LQVAYGSTGDEVVLTSSNGTTASQLNRDTEHTELPAYPANFMLTPDGNMAVVTMPGPDYVTVVQYEAMNHPPTPFSLILPENNDTVDFVEPGLATVVWQSSHDPDAGETATYSAQFRLLSSDVDTTIDFSALTDTTYTLSLMDSAGISTWTHYVRVQWLVRAISNGDTVDSREQWIFRLAPRSNSVGPALSPIPAEYSFSVYPNPFNPITTLEFALPRAGHVEISLYDLTGRLVETLMNKELPEGVHRISLDGSELPAGMYFVRMSSREFAGIKKIVLLK